MRFEMLGPLRVTDGDAELDIGGPRQQRVLGALLAAEPDALSVDQLIDEVWGEEAPDTARHVIRTYVSNLRGLLGDHVVSDGQRYQIDTAGASTDASEFVGALDDARAILSSDPVRAAELLDGAISLWRGRPFGDLANGTPILEHRSIELGEIHVQSVEMSVAAQLALGRNDQAIPRLESLVREHPFRERLHQQLMLALYRSDRQAEALRVGRNLHAVLADELGIEPSTETRRLEDRILLQDQGLDLLPPTNLPSFVSSLIGRRQETAEVSKLVDVHRLVTLVGVGGIGKTRLARQVGDLILGRFSDGVWWVDLATLPAGGSVAAKTVGVFGLGGQPGVSLEMLLVRYLAGRRLLLVFDNCEHVVDEVSTLSKTLLEAAPDLHVLATSRRVLHAPGEVRYTVPPMSLPLGVVGSSDAERLFVERSTAVDDRFVVDDGSARDVAAICRTLEGLPLAIEMAAARVSALSPAQIIERLPDRMHFLTTGTADTDRHRSLGAMIDWSYELLTAEQQILFDRLSIFVGTFDLGAAEEVAGWAPLSPGRVLDDLASLVDASMVSHERSGNDVARYRMLDTLRAYGRRRLRDRGEERAVGQRHSRYFLEVVERSTDLVFTPRHSVAMARLDAVNDDLLAALDWSLEHDERSNTLKAASGLARYWFWRGDPDAAYRYGVRMLEDTHDVPERILPGAQICYAFGCQLRGDFAEAVSAMALALGTLENGDDWELLIWACNGQGQGGVLAGQPKLSASMGRHILEICEEHNADLPRAYGLALLGEAEFFGDGDFVEARKAVSEAIPLFRELGDDAALNMFGLGILAGIAALQLDFDAAERAAIEAATLGGPSWSATALIILGGFVLHPRGETDRAEEVLTAGLQRAHERSMDIWARTALLMLGRIAAQRERWEDAARMFGGCRPLLPPWAQHQRWWTDEPIVRDALGDEAYERIAAAAAAEPIDDLVAWAAAQASAVDRFQR